MPSRRPSARPKSRAGPDAKAVAARLQLPVETFREVDLRDAVVLAAFPTAGSASSIAAQYLVRRLRLPLVAHFLLPEMPGLVAIEDGRVTSAVRVYGGDVECRIGRDCPRVFLVTTELALPAPVLLRLGETVMAWAGQGGAHILLALEAVVRADEDRTPDVFVAAADPKVLKSLEAAGLPAMSRALIAGITAQLLIDAPRRGVPSGALLVEASRDHPDGRAAAALVQAVAKMMPGVKIDAGPLLKEAAELEELVKRARDQAGSTGAPPQATFI